MLENKFFYWYKKIITIEFVTEMTGFYLQGVLTHAHQVKTFEYSQSEKNAILFVEFTERMAFLFMNMYV